MHLVLSATARAPCGLRSPHAKLLLGLAGLVPLPRMPFNCPFHAPPAPHSPESPQAQHSTLYPQYPLPHAMALLNVLYVTNYLLMYLSPHLTLKWLEHRPHHIQLCIFKSQTE